MIESEERVSLEAAQDSEETVQASESDQAMDAKAQAASDLETLQAELERLGAQAQEYLDGWQRARAELANARKRFEKERAEIGLYANADLLRKLLPVSDDFDRALAAMPADAPNQAWVEGMAMIYRKLQTALEGAGVSVIPVQPGDAFDPEVHEAITHEESENHASGAIIAEVQKGYRLGENVLRPALVRVAK